ncbi:hypothetical protein Tco_1226975, partial [Tanacetum coccineum]
MELELTNSDPNANSFPILKRGVCMMMCGLFAPCAEMEVHECDLLSISYYDLPILCDACTSAIDLWMWELIRLRGELTKTKLIEEHVRLAKQLTVDSLDDLFDYLQQFERLVNASRAKKLEKYHDPLALVAHTGSSFRQTSSYYVTHPTSVVDYDDEYQQDDMSLCLRGVVEGMNALKETGMFSKGSSNSIFRQYSTVKCYNCVKRGHYARYFPKPRVVTRKKNSTADIHYFDDGHAMESAFLCEVQSSSIEEINEKQWNVIIAVLKKINITVKEQAFFTHHRQRYKSMIFCQDQVKPILNELKVYLEFFQNLFQWDIKEMKDGFESTESEIDELEKQNDLLKDQLLEASLKQDVELCVLINHECVDKILNAELEKVKKKSFEIQEGLQARIKILEKDVQRCEKQSVDFQLKLQHEKEKQKWDSTSKNKTTIPLDYSWISKMEKLEDENVSLDFKVQSLIKERDNAKMEYKKLFDSIKKTRSQTQKEMDELIVHVSEKTYAYGAIRAENQNLLSTISELKTRLEKVEKGMNATSRVRRPMSKDSHVAHSVLDNSKKAAKNIAVYVRKNKQTDNTSANVISNKKNVLDVDVTNASKAKTLLCVS